MFKNFIIAFKKTYAEIYKDKIAAKKYLKYLYEEVEQHNKLVEMLQDLAEVLGNLSYTSGVSNKIYCDYFMRPYFFLKYDMHISEGRPHQHDPNGTGYIKALTHINEEICRHYNGAKLLYHMHKYKECLQEIKDVVKLYNEEWKKLDEEHYPLSLPVKEHLNFTN